MMTLLEHWLYDLDGKVIGHLLYADNEMYSWFDIPIIKNGLIGFKKVEPPTGKIFTLKIKYGESK